MDICLQIILNSSVLLFGILCLFPFGSKINLFTLTGLSWFLGWGVIGLAGIGLVVLGVQASLIKITMVSLSILGAIWMTNSFRRIREGIGLEYCFKIVYQ